MSADQEAKNPSQEEADKVSEVLLSNMVNYWTGKDGREFEKEFAAFADSDYSIAVANGFDLFKQLFSLSILVVPHDPTVNESTIYKTKINQGTFFKFHYLKL